VLSLALTTVIAVLVTWIGLSAAYYSVYPIGFFVSTVAFAVYLVAQLARGADRLRTGRARRVAAQ
jgi:zinc/manganese transport system permease protein